MLKADEINVLLEFKIQCDHVIKAKRSDIVVVVKEKRVFKTFDAAVGERKSYITNMT